MRAIWGTSVAAFLLGCGSGVALPGDGQVDAAPLSPEASAPADGPARDVGATPDVVLPPEMVRGSYVVTMTIEDAPAAPDRPVWPEALPAVITFSMSIRANDYVYVSTDGRVDYTLLKPDGTGWTTTDIVSIGAALGAACQRYRAFSYSMYLERDGDGLRGTAIGAAGEERYDNMARPFKGTIRAVRDHVPPTVSANAHPHPGENLIVTASEALEPRAKLSLVADDGTVRPLERDPGSPFDSARYILDVVGTRGGQVSIAGPLTDLGGNAAPQPSLPRIEPLVVPLLPEDGFEGSTPFLSGSAIMTAPRAITGARSLFVPLMGLYACPAVLTHATWRLSVAPGDSVVRASVVLAFKSMRADPFRPVINAVGRDGAWRRSEVLLEPGPLTPVGSPPLWLSAPLAVEVPLPPGAENEVLIDVRGDLENLSPPAPNLIVDDVRVE